MAFSAPADNGGSPITGYALISVRVESRTGDGIADHRHGSHQWHAYTFTVQAPTPPVRANSRSRAKRPRPSGAATPPGTPALTGDAAATLSLRGTGDHGGSPITSYEVTSDPGGITASGTESPIVLTGLTNGTAYTFTVRASNARREGDASPASASVTPDAAGSSVDRDRGLR